MRDGKRERGLLTTRVKGIGWFGELSVEAILIHCETNFACETRHIIHVVVFKCI